MDEGKKKKCFIITPIGDNGSEIRRHIDGIIDAALIPVLEEHFDYELEVAHRIDAPGNIPKQVITSIYHSDLVVANLTGNNPNVMYELALRHCFGTAVIVIAEDGTKIPADIVSERTIFYVNDAQGVLDLKDKLESMVQRIQESNEIKQSGPVYDALKEALDRETVIEKISVSENADAFAMILNKLDILQKDIRMKAYDSHEKGVVSYLQGKPEYVMKITCNVDNSKALIDVMSDEIVPLLDKMNIKNRWSKNGVDSVRLVLQDFNIDQLSIVEAGIRKSFRKYNIYEASIIGSFREADRI